jgi:hypothetical protein
MPPFDELRRQMKGKCANIGQAGAFTPHPAFGHLLPVNGEKEGRA